MINLAAEELAFRLEALGAGIPSDTQLGWNSITVEGAFPLGKAAEVRVMICAALRIAPSLQRDALKLAGAVDAKGKLHALAFDREVGLCMGRVRRRPCHLFMAEHGGQPDGLRRDPARRRACDVRSCRAHERQEPQNLPLHLPFAVDKAIKAPDRYPMHAYGSAPDHSTLPADDLLRREGKPAP